jgi:hypothetical protein
MIKVLMCASPCFADSFAKFPFSRSCRNETPLCEKRIECDCGNGSNPLFDKPQYKNLYKRRCSVIVYPTRKAIFKTVYV